MFKAFVGIAAGVLAWTWICTGAAADKAPPAKRAAQSSQAPAGVGAKKQPALQGEPKPTPASGTKGRSNANADARYCLDLPTNYAIIKCAEKYL